MTYMATIKLADDRERTKAAAAAKVQIGKAWQVRRPERHLSCTAAWA